MGKPEKKEDRPAGEPKKETKKTDDEEKEEDDSAKVIKADTLPDPPAKNDDEELGEIQSGLDGLDKDKVSNPVPDFEKLLEEGEGGCDGLAGCQKSTQEKKKEVLSVTADSEKCDKNDAKMTSRIAEQAKKKLSNEGELSKTKQTLSTLMGTMPHTQELGEAADVAADALIKSAAAEMHAHKVASRAHRPEELAAAVKAAADAKREGVIAELRVTQVATAA